MSNPNQPLFFLHSEDIYSTFVSLVTGPFFSFKHFAEIFLYISIWLIQKSPKICNHSEHVFNRFENCVLAFEK